jgi:uncharacterized membrane protein YciS (DUF1049 family)
MFLLGLLLLIAVIAVVVFVLSAGADQHVQLSADWLNLNWRPSLLVVFLIGALCLLLVGLALGLMSAGVRRKARRRRELKRLRDAERERGTTPATSPTADREAHVRPNSPDDRDDRGEYSPDTHRIPTTHDDQPTAPAPAKGGWHDDPDDGRGGSSPVA